VIAGGSSFYRRAPRILIVEDELFIALLIEETVRLIGCRISAIADNISKANLELCKCNFDVVLLDLNIGGNYSTELADRVIKAKVPLAFITGYDYRVEPRHAHVPVLQKPFRPAQLNALLVQLLGPIDGDSDRSTAHRDRFHLLQSPLY
jgi:two-component SAPR family response regulator